MIDVVEARRLEKKSLTWWFGAVVAPIGILGGPLALANMLAGTIQWQGLPGYLVHYWGESVTPAFRVLFDYLLLRTGLPPVSDSLTNYYVIGLLYVSSELRAMQLVGTLDDRWRHALRNLQKGGLRGVWLSLILVFGVPLFVAYGILLRLCLALIWPAQIAYALLLHSAMWLMLRSLKQYFLALQEENSVRERDGLPPIQAHFPIVQDYPEFLPIMQRSNSSLLLTILPFALFLLLWAASELS